HKNAVIQIHAAHWAEQGAAKPVMAIGFSDNTPATHALLSAIANLPKGAIVCQGLDTDMDAQSWDALSPLHPQYGLSRLLAALGKTRDDVQAWDAKPKLSSFARAHNVQETAD